MSADMSVAMNTLHMAMNLEQMRARVAAHNIAMANVPGSQVMRFDSVNAMAGLKSTRGDQALFAQMLSQLRAQDLNAYTQPDTSGNALSLDAEVAELSAASGQYQRLADAVSRQFALMQLAIRGGR